MNNYHEPDTDAPDTSKLNEEQLRQKVARYEAALQAIVSGKARQYCDENKLLLDHLFATTWIETTAKHALGMAETWAEDQTE